MIDQIRELGHKITALAITGAHLVEVIPAMKYMPECLAGWKKRILQWHRSSNEFLENLNADVAANLVSFEDRTP